MSDADVARLADLEPDLAVLTGLSGISPLERLNERRPGEFHAVGPPGDLLGIWARGIFLECQGANALWTLTVGRDGGTPVLPDESDGPGGGPARSGAGTMVLALPRVQAVGVVPLLAFVVPTATSDLASAEWPLSTVAGARALASAAMIGDADLVAAGHIAVLPGMGRITAVLDGAGLHDAGGPPTWPGRIGSWPFLAQFRLERVLAGAHWRTARTRSGAMDGAHRALLVELEPAGADDSPPGDARRD